MDAPHHEAPVRSTAQQVFMNVWTAMRSVKWKHAVAEVVLVVVAVLVALWVNNWNSDRQKRDLERTLLSELRSALLADVVALRAAEADFRAREGRMVALQEHLTRRRPYSDNLVRDFGAIIGLWETHLNRSPYEVLKARGLDLVSSDSLRLRIVTLYDQAYANLAVSEDDDRSVVFEVVRPYFLLHFRDIRFREAATPLDYAAVARDPIFRNVLDYRLLSLRANAIGPTEAADSAVAVLLAQLSLVLQR